MMIKRHISMSLRALTCAAVVSFISIAPAGAAAPDDGRTSCPAIYYEGGRPQATNPKLAVSSRELCSDHYAVWYSGVARSPIWAAEFMTKAKIEAGRSVSRSENFRPDARLPSDWRNSLDDFRGSGMDRGHLVPSASAPTPAADSQTFLLSNIIAQDPKLNRGLWAAIEKGVRAHAMHQPIYVITGPMFIGATIERLNNRVLIPTHVYKLVYEPARNVAAAYVVENLPGKRHREVSLEDLEKMAGINFLPLAKNVGLLKLPKPRY